MKNKIIILTSVFLFGLKFLLLAQNPVLTIDLNKKGVPISDTHYGIFFEDINHAADGGLYAELIRNRSFEETDKPDYWNTFNTSGTSITSSIVTSDLLNSTQKQALKLTILTGGLASSVIGIYNTGFWGINVKDNEQYDLSFFAKCDANFTGRLIVQLVDNSNSVVYASDTLSGLTSNWENFSSTLKATGNCENARFQILFTSRGNVWLDVVSLFPPTFNNRKNGLRKDLANMLVELNPKFVRFPGGCFVEGDYLVNRFQWKQTVGNVEDRPGHYNLWGYQATDGMGYLEYLELCEDLNAEPLYVINVGLGTKDSQPVDDLDWYIQDALDAIEYANGNITTTYGAMRAAQGHPETFNLKYIEIGNENYYQDNYGTRYKIFRDAILAKYPDIKIIGNVAPWGTDNPSWTFSHPVDYVDEHYYRSPQWFIDQYNKYDSYDRNGPLVYVGEYAVTSGCGKGNMIAALGEAVYMAGMEKNADIVQMNSYAPIFVNENDRYWNPDMIVYNASKSYGTPSYYVQELFANNIGDVNVSIKDSLNTILQPIIGKIGVGSWATQVEYDDVEIAGSDNSVLFSDTFSDASNWTPGTGTWDASTGVYKQTSSSTNCTSVALSINDTAYVYSLKAKKTGGNEGFLVIFGYQDSNNYYWWNIGGWGNTKNAIEHCVNGSKSTISSSSGSIQSNVWYDLRIEITPSKVSCYLDNTLINSFENTPSNTLYTSATVSESNNKLFLKVINPSGSSVNSKIKFKNLLTNNIISGEVTVLSSNSGLDENTFDNPEKILPITTSINEEGSELFYNFKPYSVSIFKLSTLNTSGLSTATKENENFQIFPNPVKNMLNVEVDYSPFDKIEVDIYTLSGKLVLKKYVKSRKFVVDISNFDAGAYVFKMSDGTKIVGSQTFFKE